MINKACLAIAFALALPAHAQQTIPRTPDGRPDFQGYWSNEFLTPLERLEGATSLVVSDAEAKKLVQGIQTRRSEEKFDPGVAFPEAKQLAKVHGDWRTSLIVDPPTGKLPVTPEGKKLLAEFPGLDARATNNPEERAFSERCLAGPSRAPIMIPVESMFNEIVQTQGFLVFHSDHYSELRLIGIGAQHRRPELVAWQGDSVATWDGDTLVVETTNSRAEETVRNRLVIRPQSRVVEHFRLISADELLYQFTIEDPAIYDRPWMAEYSFSRTSSPVYEFACHEGNYGLSNILAGARITEGRKPTRRKAHARR
jgi:hypothetical protein